MYSLWEYLQKVDAILKEGKRTAFVCTADEYALEIMKDQKRAKRKASVDYGITGFDNIDTLAYVTPQLSTISMWWMRWQRVPLRCFLP